MRPSKHLSWAAAFLCAQLASVGAPAAGAPLETAPQRVVSMNLCTDQLAMMLAGDGQLISVSHLALQERYSAMAQQAQNLHANKALAEEIYLLKPDLVVAGRYSSGASIDMLRRLDIPVVTFDPAYGLSDVVPLITQMGAALHREAAAEALITRYQSDLSALQKEVKDRPRAALYAANGWTSGDKSLAGQILSAAGFDNIATEAGMPGGGVLPLEVLAMTDPDAIITGARQPAASRSEAILDHPILEHLHDRRFDGLMTDSDWICGTPYVLRAIAELAQARKALEAKE